MKRALLTITSILIILLLCTSCSSFPVSTITSIDFSYGKSSVNVEAGNYTTGYFKVVASGDYSLDELKLISSDTNIATFELENHQVGNLIYYKINGLRSGSTSVHIETSDGTVKSSELAVIVSGYIYNIVDNEDTSIPNARRATLRVTASEDCINSMDDALISDMLKFIADEYVAERDINAVVIYLYYEGDDTSGGYTVASCVYAPEGDISKAPYVDAGDYSTFDYKIDINSESERQLYRN